MTAEEKYKIEFEKLNSEQKIAVNSIYGPVLVLAGPGTGKTQILSMRIANLLLSDAQVNPYNILCLTFTDEGQKNMRERLINLIGSKTAQHIHVHTFHSFCNEIIQNNLRYFRKDELELVSDLDKVDFMNSLTANISKKSYYYSPKNPMKNAETLQNLFTKIKQEAWTAEELILTAEAEIERLKNDPASISTRNPTKGKIKTTVSLKIEQYEKTIQAAKLFSQYQDILNEHNRYEYADMILWVIELLQKVDEIKFDLQEKYQFILVDEMQDSSGSQMQLINLLCDYDSSPNIFAVGDDDQAIYRFQGANLDNIISFRRKYLDHGLTEICLKENFRSFQGILDSAGLLIENNKKRLIYDMPQLDKKLISFNTTKTKIDSQPILLEHENPLYQYAAVAYQIRDLIEKQKVAPDEIAVLCPKNDQCKEMGAHLKALQIPCYVKSAENLFKQTFFKQLYIIFQYINNEFNYPYNENEFLFEILHFNMFQIRAQDIAKISIDNFQFNKGKDFVQRKNLRQFILEEIATKNLSLFNASANDIVIVTQLLEKLIKAKANHSLYQLMDMVIKELEIIPYIMQHEDKYSLLEQLDNFYKIIKEATDQMQDLNLKIFLERMNLLRENDIPLPYYKIYGSDKNVKVYTLHAAKGREFEYVFMLNCTANDWESKRGRTAIKIPPAMLGADEDSNDKEELRRLFYVGMTRAKKQIFLSYYNHDAKNKESDLSIFLFEAFGTDDKKMQAQTIKNSLTQEDLSQFIYLHQEKSDIEIAQIEKDFVERQLEDFQLNPTALNQYLKCPLSFYYNSILRIPSGKNETLTFGSVIHNVLEHFFKTMLQNKKQWPEKTVLAELFEKEMYASKAKFSDSGFRLKHTYGMELLNALYDKFINTWNKDVKLEENITANWDGIRIKGFVDKIEYYPSELVMIDYKTGDLNNKTTMEKLKRPYKKRDGDQSLGGDYWRQAVFYKILSMENNRFLQAVNRAQYIFLEPDKKTKEIPDAFEFIFTEEDIAIVKNQIKECWEAIHRHEFYTGCGEEKCNACNFARDSNQILISELLSEDERV